MRIHILTLDGVFDTGLSSVLDTFATANDLAGPLGIKSARFDVSIVGVRRRVRTSQGLLVPVQPAASIRRSDVIIVPALDAKTPETLQVALERRDVVDAGKFICDWAKKDALISAACTSTFVLAETALLDEQRVTTTWWLAPMFRLRYPHIELDESRMVIESDRFITAGAAVAHIDLALWLVRRCSPMLSALTARHLVVDARSSQAAYVSLNHLAHVDPTVERFERWARARLTEGFSLSEAAYAVGTSERTLTRRLQSVLGKSPLAYFQALRVERAIYLLQTTHASVDQIAAQVGYADGATLRNLLRRQIGRGVRELRRRD